MVTQMTVAPEGLYIALDKIRDDLDQVRRDWGHDGGKEKLDELTESIRQHGVLQPIEVSLRRDGLYDVLVGHRRFDAARRAGLAAIPTILRDATEQERTILQLVENMVRQDLSFVDKAQAMQDLINANQWTQRELARQLGTLPQNVSVPLRVFSDPVLRLAVQHGLIGVIVAGRLHSLSSEYSAPLYDALRAGQPVSYKDVLQAGFRQKKAGVHSDYHDRRRGTRASATELKAREIERRRTEEGATYEQIARDLGMSRSHVRRLHMSADRDTSFSPTDSTMFSRRIFALRDNGLSLAKIAGILGVEEGTVRRHLRAKTRTLPDDPDADRVTDDVDDPPGLNVTVDPPTRLVVRVEPITDPPTPAPTPNAVRSPLPYCAPDAPQKPQERSASMEITAYQQPSRPAEVTWCDVCAPFAGAAFERALSWAASHGMTAVDMLDQYRAQCR